MNMVNDEIKLEEAPVLDTAEMSDGELTVDDLGGNWLKNPAVGESTEFVVRSIVKNTKDLLPTNPKTQKKMKLALSGVDYNIHINATSGKVFAISSWEVWGKLKAIWKKLANGQKGWTMANQQVRVKHLLNGLLDENKDKYCYEVAVLIDGKYLTLDRKTNEWVAA